MKWVLHLLCWMVKPKILILSTFGMGSPRMCMWIFGGDKFFVFGGSRSSWDLAGEQVRPARPAASITASTPLCRVFSISASLPLLIQSVMSSAYKPKLRLGICWSCWGMAKTARLNSKGERTAPCGVPFEGRVRVLEVISAICIIAVLFVRKLRI